MVTPGGLCALGGRGPRLAPGRPGTGQAFTGQVLTGLASQSRARPTLREERMWQEEQGSTHMGHGT